MAFFLDNEYSQKCGSVLQEHTNLLCFCLNATEDYTHKLNICNKKEYGHRDKGPFAIFTDQSLAQ